MSNYRRRYFKVGRIRKTELGRYHVTLEITRETMLNLVNIACVQDVPVEEALARAARLGFVCWCIDEEKQHPAKVVERGQKIVEVATKCSERKKDIEAVSDIVVDAFNRLLGGK